MKGLKKIENVFISEKNNNLQLVNIYFDSSIKKIEPLTHKIFSWTEVDSKTKRKKIANQFSIKNDKQLLLAIPGGIDSHVHFDTPGYEFREDFTHASKAAIAGGTTTIIDMPCTSIPPVTTLKNFQIKLNAIKNKGKVNRYFWGGISGNDFNIKKDEKNIFDLANAGVVGFKVYVISGMKSFSDLSYEQIKIAAKIVAESGKILAVHAEDKDLVLSRELEFKRQNKNDWKHYCKSRDVNTELIAVEKMIEVSRETNCKIHVVHLSSKKALDKINEAQNLGVKISTETCPHYLFFTQRDFENEKIRNYLKTAPPVKNEIDKKALWRGLKNGSISFVTTDHAGCNPKKEKSSENFWQVYSGIPGVQHRVSFLISEGFLKNKISLQKTIELLSTNAAKFFNIERKGELKINYDADIVLIDLWKKQKINSNEMYSKGKYTPFEGITFNCVVEKTYVGGKLIYRRS